MKKMVYVVISANKGADEFDVFHSFDKAEAVKEAKSDREHMSEHDRKRSEHSVQGYLIEVNEGETAKDAYRDACLDDMIIDPDEYIEIYVEGDPNFNSERE